MHKTFFVAATLIACCLEAHAEDFAFAYPPPSNASAMKTVSLWSTQYLIHSAQAKPPSPDTVELKRRDGTGFGIHLQRRDWCNAVMEGTVSVAQNNTISTFNVDGLQDEEQTDCSFMFHHTEPAVLKRLGRQVFTEVKGARIYGLGTNGFRLVPYRTVAVDQSKFAPGTVFFIPGLRGKQIRLPAGNTVSHDGYVFAGDKGGSIKNNHIDFFTGIEKSNPAPGIITSKSTRTFRAYVVTDQVIVSELKSLHLKK